MAAHKLLPAVVRKPGPKTIAPDRVTKSWIDRLNIDLVVDVGANEGQFVKLVRKRGYKGTIVSFEPLDAAYNKLNSRFRHDLNWKGFQLALGERDAELTMQVAGNQLMSSSLLAMLPNHVEALPESAIFTTESVKVRRLDDALAPVIGKAERLFVKVDTQGFEDQVLKGSTGILDKIVLLELELSLVPLYSGQMLMPDMMNLVSKIGFTPVFLERMFSDDFRGKLLQVDGLFVRNEHLDVDPV